MSPLFYVRLDDARDMRRTLLETSKAAIHCLRAYQDLVRARGEKVAMLNSLRRELRELTTMINRLEKLLPMLGEAEIAMLRPPEPLPDLDAEFEKQAAKGGKRVAPSSPIKRTEPKAAADSLADRLAMIERTLNSL